jgi:hypothetical protein
MKKLISFLLFVALSAGAQAQGISASVNIGYALGAGKQVVGQNFTPTSGTNINGSFGQGINLGVGLVFMFSENLGADVGFSTDNSSSVQEQTYVSRATMFRIMPGIKVVTEVGKNLSAYGRFGLVLGVDPKLYDEVTDTNPNATEIKEFEAYGGATGGWYGAFGIGITLTERLKMNTELTLINQTWAPEKYENISNSDGGPLRPTITYSDNFYNTNPDTELKNYLPFGSFGLNVGLELGF